MGESHLSRLSWIACVLTLNCLGPDTIPTVDAELRVEPSVLTTNSQLDVTISVTNHGPGFIWAAIPCPPFTATSDQDELAYAGNPCSAVPTQYVKLQPTEALVQTSSWNGIGWGGGRVANGDYYIVARAEVFTRDKNQLQVDIAPRLVELVP